MGIQEINVTATGISPDCCLGVVMGMRSDMPVVRADVEAAWPRLSLLVDTTPAALPRAPGFHQQTNSVRVPPGLMSERPKRAPSEQRV